MRIRTTLFAILSISSFSLGATIGAKPGDDLQRLVNNMNPGDELILADGNYPNASIDFGRIWNVTVRAQDHSRVTIARENGQPLAKPPSGVVLNGKGKPFVFRGGSGIKLIGFTIDGCSNTLQQGRDPVRQRLDPSRCDRATLRHGGRGDSWR